MSHIKFRSSMLWAAVSAAIGAGARRELRLPHLLMLAGGLVLTAKAVRLSHECALLALPLIKAGSDEGRILAAMQGAMGRMQDTITKVTAQAKETLSVAKLQAEVEALVASEVNPALAAHGGFVTYVGHDDDGTVYIVRYSLARLFLQLIGNDLQ